MEASRCCLPGCTAGDAEPGVGSDLHLAHVPGCEAVPILTGTHTCDRGVVSRVKDKKNKAMELGRGGGGQTLS